MSRLQVTLELEWQNTARGILADTYLLPSRIAFSILILKPFGTQNTFDSPFGSLNTLCLPLSREYGIDAAAYVWLLDQF